LKLDYANVTFAAERVPASGKATAVATSFNVSTNIADVGIDPLQAEIRGDADIRLDGDSFSVTVALNDKVRQDTKNGNLEIRLAGLDYDALHFDLTVAQNILDGSYNIDTGMTLFDDRILGARVVSNGDLGVLSARVEAPESFLLPKPYLMTLETDGYGVGGSTGNRLQVDMLHQVGQSSCFYYYYYSATTTTIMAAGDRFLPAVQRSD
jgi:hypothetical protein